jgi:flavodoxin
MRNALTRRSLTRRSLIRYGLGGGLATAGLLTGCTPEEPAPAGGATPSPPQTPAPTPSEPDSDMSANSNRVLLAYFSRAGENYWYGGRRNLRVGNTERLAGMIADRIDCEVYQIEEVDTYPQSYDATVARNSREQDQDARPEIADPLPDLSGYRTILLASPIWNVRPPMIMNTFLDGVELAGKNVLPVVTYAISGLGRTAEVYTEALPDSAIGDGLAVQGEEVRQSEDQLERWLASSGLTS